MDEEEDDGDDDDDDAAAEEARAANAPTVVLGGLLRRDGADRRPPSEEDGGGGDGDRLRPARNSMAAAFGSPEKEAAGGLLLGSPNLASTAAGRSASRRRRHARGAGAAALFCVAAADGYVRVQDAAAGSIDAFAGLAWQDRPDGGGVFALQRCRCLEGAGAGAGRGGRQQVVACARDGTTRVYDEAAGAHVVRTKHGGGSVCAASAYAADRAACCAAFAAGRLGGPALGCCFVYAGFGGKLHVYRDVARDFSSSLADRTLIDALEERGVLGSTLAIAGRFRKLLAQEQQQAQQEQQQEEEEEARAALNARLRTQLRTDVGSALERRARLLKACLLNWSGELEPRLLAERAKLADLEAKCASLEARLARPDMHFK